MIGLPNSDSVEVNQKPGSISSAVTRQFRLEFQYTTTGNVVNGLRQNRDDEMRRKRIARRHNRNCSLPLFFISWNASAHLFTFVLPLICSSATFRPDQRPRHWGGWGGGSALGSGRLATGRNRCKQNRPPVKLFIVGHLVATLSVKRLRENSYETTVVMACAEKFRHTGHGSQLRQLTCGDTTTTTRSQTALTIVTTAQSVEQIIRS